jgi:contact-dependent growth inhibition (CDI) system CdiA-like toxin
VRHPDRPERSVRSELASLRERLDALPASHPSSPGFAADAALAAFTNPQEAAGERSQPELERGGRDLERCGGGSVDQGARAFKAGELAIAEALADRGAVVVALAEDSSMRRPQPDALVDGRVTEFKSLSLGATDATVKNQLRAAQRQAPNVVVDARGSGLEENSAALGLRRFLGSPWAQGRYASILVLGDGYMIETSSPREPRDE